MHCSKVGLVLRRKKFVKFVKFCFAAYSNISVILKVVVDVGFMHAWQQGMFDGRAWSSL